MLENQQKKKVEIAKIRVKLNVLKDDLEIAVRERDFMKAQDMQMEIDELDENLQVSSFLDGSRWGRGERGWKGKRLLPRFWQDYTVCRKVFLFFLFYNFFVLRKPFLKM